jgi:hypothetical protein
LMVLKSIQVLAISVILLRIVVSVGIVKNILYGNLFEAPCLREIEKKANAVAVEKRQQDVWESATKKAKFTSKRANASM